MGSDLLKTIKNQRVFGFGNSAAAESIVEILVLNIIRTRARCFEYLSDSLVLSSRASSSLKLLLIMTTSCWVLVYLKVTSKIFIIFKPCEICQTRKKKDNLTQF